MTGDEKLDLILSSVMELKADVQNMQTDMHGMKADVQNMQTEMCGMKTDVQNMQIEMQGMKEELKKLNEKVDNLDKRVSSLEMTLENETNRNIHIIAEGHLDLSRKLDLALQVENEREMMLVRLTTLENEVNKIKEIVY